MTQGRTGRRPGNPDTRREIIEAAIESFVAYGYDGTSVRGIARAAGVDPALIHRWFGGKDGLLLAAFQTTHDMEAAISSVVAQGRVDLAHHILTTVVGIWESPTGKAILQTMRQRPTLVPVLIGYLTPRYSEAASILGMPRRDADLRATLVMSQIAGLAVVRYLAQIEPLASMPANEVIRLYTPLVQQALTVRRK